jgi:hypothetical protein
MNTETAALEFARRLVAGASITEVAIVDALAARHSNGEPLENLVDELAAGYRRRTPSAGEMGLHEIIVFAMPVVIPALWEVVKAGAKKFGEKAVERILNDILAKLAKPPDSPEAKQAWDGLEVACAAEAKRLGLSEDSYREFMIAARRRPEMLLSAKK